MPVKVGINGFGRIGRQVLKAILERHKGKIEVVAVNDLADPETNAHLFRFDSNYGRYPGTVDVRDGNLVIDGSTVKVFQQRDPAQIPWGEVGAEIVVESTGVFTDAEKARAHLRDTVKKVVISAPAKNEDLTIVLGVNDDMYDPRKHHVVSNASCTTNCIAPVVKVLHDAFGIRRGLMSTVHAYTNDQRILDLVHSDLRRARAAAINIVPTSTGAAKAVTLVIPELKGKLHGMAFRVPTSTVSVVDFVADVERTVTAEEVNDAFREAAVERMKGILEVEDRPLVSIDFKGHPASSIVDAELTMVMDGDMVKVVSWYDNEWGYSCRTADLCALLGEKGW
ncbi:MAG TPA: type I glyceraldehyde-3-phosphate dehydrogenase [Candidatus Tectomicrobia bacterium]|nr:type I glyceraldehyde-3-phosphate dehydrogenase [Candidatus Tectomicrobia bacterium]